MLECSSLSIFEIPPSILLFSHRPSRFFFTWLKLISIWCHLPFTHILIGAGLKTTWIIPHRVFVSPCWCCKFSHYDVFMILDFRVIPIVCGVVSWLMTQWLAFVLLLTNLHSSSGFQPCLCCKASAYSLYDYVNRVYVCRLSLMATRLSRSVLTSPALLYSIRIFKFKKVRVASRRTVFLQV